MATSNLSAENVYSGCKPSEYPIQNDLKPGKSHTPTRLLSEEERNSPSGLRSSLAQLHADEQKGYEWVDWMYQGGNVYEIDESTNTSIPPDHAVLPSEEEDRYEAKRMMLNQSRTIIPPIRAFIREKLH